MSKKKVEEIVEEMLIPIVDRYSFELVDVEYVKEGANWYLRTYIDKEDGINIDDCEAVSKELSKKLDEEDPIDQSYFLEVSSPGLDRPLKKDKDFMKYRGETVEVRLFHPFNGKKIYEGELLGLINGRIVIKPDKSDSVEFEKSDVAVVKRSVHF